MTTENQTEKEEKKLRLEKQKIVASTAIALVGVIISITFFYTKAISNRMSDTDLEKLFLKLENLEIQQEKTLLRIEKLEEEIVQLKKKE